MPQVRVSLRARSGGLVAVNTGCHGRLFLTMEEANILATDLELQIICVGEHPPAEVIVADVRLTAEEAWQVVDGIHGLLGVDNQHPQFTSAVPWSKEGF